LGLFGFRFASLASKDLADFHERAFARMPVSLSAPLALDRRFFASAHLLFFP
jgi:hypothetical protein